MDNNERRRALEAAAIESAAHGLKALLLLNGGACIALIAFVGSIATSSSLRPEFSPLVGAASRALIWFAAGAAVQMEDRYSLQHAGQHNGDPFAGLLCMGRHKHRHLDALRRIHPATG